MRTASRSCCAGIGLVFCAATMAVAQETDTDLYDGKWSVRVQGVAAGYQSAQLVIANYAGTWRDTSSKATTIDKACRAKSFPVTVQRSTASSFEFTVWGSSVSPACPDLSVSIKPTQSKALEGSIDPAGTIKLIRQ
jgi:hypothetical protein